MKNAAFGENPFHSLGRRLRAKALRTLFRLFRVLGRPVPRSIGTIEDVNTFAGTNYHPSIYPGALTLFRATTRDPLEGDDEFLGWSGLAKGGIEVYHVPATHQDFLQEPGVRILSEKLSECLNRRPKLEPAATAAEVSESH